MHPILITQLVPIEHSAATAHRRPDVRADHAYTVPIVRELPPPHTAAVGDRSW